MTSSVADPQILFFLKKNSQFYIYLSLCGVGILELSLHFMVEFQGGLFEGR